MTSAKRRDYIVFGATILVLAGVAALVVWQWPMIRDLFTDADAFLCYVNNFGPMAPVAYFGIYVISVIIAVVPATFLNFLGGAMFGWWQGALLSWTANILGAFIAIWLFRGVARSVVHIFFPERKLERFQKFVRKRGWAYLFILYMVPAPPGDVLNFASAASDIRLYKLIIMIAIARLPVIIGRSIIGTSMVSFNVLQWIILGASLFVVLGLVYLLRNQINSLAERFSARFFPLPANRNKSIDKQ